MSSAIRRVVLIPSWYPTPECPVNGIFVEDQARVLSERFEVLVFTQQLYGVRAALRGRIPARSGFVSRNGVRVFEQRVFIPPKASTFAVMERRLKYAKRALQTVARGWGKPELLHAHVVLPGGWIATRLGRELGIPVVLTEHTGPFSAHLGSPSHRTLVEEALTACTRVIAVSPSLSGQMKQAVPSLQIEVVGNVIPTHFFRPANVEDGGLTERSPLRLFSAALLAKEKGYEYLLRAMRMLLDNEFPPFELAIGGDGPDRPRLEGMIKDLNLQKCCSLLGMLTRDDLRDWMQRCDIFVLPSLAETFGLVLGEAMACGKPVLATRCGGPEFQVTPDTGILVEPGDAETLAAGIKALAARRLEYAPAKIRASVAKRFGEAAFLDAITHIYANAASRNYCS